MSLVEQLKRIYDSELPRPHYLVLCSERYKEATRELPALPNVGTLAPLLGLQIYVGEIPRNEIHFVNRRGEVYKVENIG